MTNKKFLPGIGSLVDFLTIHQMKEWKIPENRATYEKEIADIMHDIDLELHKQDSKGMETSVEMSAEIVRDIVVLALANAHVWFNEQNFRNGIKEGNNLELSHSINSVRNTAKNRLEKHIGGSKFDLKVDNIGAHPNWVPSGWTKEFKKNDSEGIPYEIGGANKDYEKKDDSK